MSDSKCYCNNENKTDISVPVIDNASIGFILDRYESLVAKNAILERENEELKQSRGKDPNVIIYPSNSPLNIAAEPKHK